MSNPVIKLSDYEPPAWLISQVELTLVINENRTEVQAQLHLKRMGFAAGRIGWRGIRNTRGSG